MRLCEGGTCLDPLGLAIPIKLALFLKGLPDLCVVLCVLRVFAVK